MSLHIERPKRPKHLVLKDIIRSLGGDKVVAALYPLSTITVSKWGEDPAESGQEIPFKHFLTLLTICGQHMANGQLQVLVDELLNEHILNLVHRIAHPREIIFQVIDILQNGYRGTYGS